MDRTAQSSQMARQSAISQMQLKIAQTLTLLATNHTLTRCSAFMKKERALTLIRKAFEAHLAQHYKDSHHTVKQRRCEPYRRCMRIQGGLGNRLAQAFLLHRTMQHAQ
jgi:hypothetical protein